MRAFIDFLLLVAGMISVFYGIANDIALWIVVGIILLLMGGVLFIYIRSTPKGDDGGSDGFDWGNPFD
jgi:hypothetical protein